jgi:pimeloyl-ACP methyl ester carboxylesterase
MPIVSLQSSPLVPGVTPVEIFYRDEGAGAPLVFLHGGWGNTLYPFSKQIDDLSQDFRILCPDRSGYGRSNRLLEEFASDFHRRAAEETLGLLDSLGIERAFFWGHSDGAVIAAILGFTSPKRVSGLILEAFHYYRMKPASRDFFESLAERPDGLDQGLRNKFAVEFGVESWQRLLSSHAKAWLKIALDGSGANDLYDGRLGEVTAPTLFLHGELDPRTEPGEIEAAHAQVPEAELRILPGAGHSPHSESASTRLATDAAREFLERHRNAVAFSGGGE